MSANLFWHSLRGTIHFIHHLSFALASTSFGLLRKSTIIIEAKGWFLSEVTFACPPDDVKFFHELSSMHTKPRSLDAASHIRSRSAMGCQPGASADTGANSLCMDAAHRGLGQRYSSAAPRAKDTG